MIEVPFYPLRARLLTLIHRGGRAAFAEPVLFVRARADVDAPCLHGAIITAKRHGSVVDAERIFVGVGGLECVVGVVSCAASGE